MRTFSRRHVATALACVPAMASLGTLALAASTETVVEPKRPLRIFSTSKGDKLTIKTTADGGTVFEWEAKDEADHPASRQGYPQR